MLEYCVYLVLPIADISLLSTKGYSRHNEMSIWLFEKQIDCFGEQITMWLA